PAPLPPPLHPFPTRRSSDLESAASLALGHLDELQAPYAREQCPRLALDSHLAQARAGIVIGDGRRKRSGQGVELKHVLEKIGQLDRKSTRLNSSHVSISYAV